ncbi:glycosyltransferase family 4 protein [Bacillus testis]|uniref:glycosyltransferase family 4 protein n=1 Tax=Bacillus testis TaxID=1622072 RepID=UPI00067F36B1|nr:glycosyltransferase family 4 protein [Bacillus testis]
MPTSWYQAVPAIIDLVMLDQPKSVLDIGIGFGKYGFLLREAFDIPYERYDKKAWLLQIDGIEGFEGYRNPIHDYVYDHVYYGKVSKVLPELTQSYDTLLLIDVLEHFDKEEGLQLIDQLLAITNTSLIVSTPIIPSVQGDYLGNELETHRSRWSIVDFADYDYHFSEVKVGDNGAYIFKFFPDEKKSKQQEKPLKIGYLLPHHGMTGGMKMLLNQMDLLHKQGHHITAFFKGEEGSTVLPKWADIEVDRQVLVPLDHLLKDHCRDCDVIVAGWIYQLAEMQNANTPVFYWEQGHESLFGDIPEYSHIQAIRSSLALCYKAGIPILSVSNFVSRVLSARYGLETDVLPNGIDVEKYTPVESRPPSDRPTILLVGNPNLRFKSFNDAIKTLSIVWAKGHRFKVKWVCQTVPAHTAVFPIEYIVQPKESELVSCYQNADLFLYTSWYEGFGMPPLEAMACGLPVVMTDCGGVKEYALNHYNCLMAEPGDHWALAEHVASLLADQEKRRYLAANGRMTALDFRYEKVMPQLVDYMRTLTE